MKKFPHLHFLNCKNYLIIFAILLLNSTVVKADIMQAAPIFSLQQIDGKILNLSDYRGKVVYLDFWASWCAPCRQSFPWMNEIQKRWEKKGLVVIAINVDKEFDLAKQFLQNNISQFKIAFDPEGKTPLLYKIKVMPTSFIIDKKGNIASVHAGFHRDHIGETELLLERIINSH